MVVENAREAKLRESGEAYRKLPFGRALSMLLAVITGSAIGLADLMLAVGTDIMKSSNAELSACRVDMTSPRSSVLAGAVCRCGAGLLATLRIGALKARTRLGHVSLTVAAIYWALIGAWKAIVVG